MSDITYIALIMSISGYHGNWSPHILHNLSQEVVAVRVGGIFEICLVIMTRSWVSTGIVPAQTPVTVPIVPYITNQAPSAYSGHLCCCSVCPQYCCHIETPQSAPMGRGRVLLTIKVTPGLVGWASPTFTGLHQGAGSVCMWAYVMNACWTAGDRDTRLVIM